MRAVSHFGSAVVQTCAVWRAVPRSCVGLTLLVWHRVSWLHHHKTSGQNQGKRQVWFLSLHGVGQSVLQVWVCWFFSFPWEFPFPGFSSCCVWLRTLLWCQAVCALGAEHCQHLWHHWGLAEVPRRLLGWGFPNRCSQALHLHAFPARRRNDSVWASPSRCHGQAGEWVR